MAHQPVGDSQTLTTGTGSTRIQFAVQTDTVRVVPISQNVHVAIGTTATATTSDYFVVAGESETLNLGRASSSRVVGVATGAATVISLDNLEKSFDLTLSCLPFLCLIPAQCECPAILFSEYFLNHLQR